MIPSYFKIEILAIRDEFVTQGHKGLTYCFVIFVVTGFLESGGDGRHSGSTLCVTVFLRCRCNVTVGDCKKSTVWNGEEDEV